ncbi:MAG: DUF4381 domain-containing protein [Spongiibacteraceae bacterium]
MPNQDPLAQLRDIHLPAAVSAWPPAIGWWLVAALLIITIIVMSYFLIRRYRKNHYRRLALKQLSALSLTTDFNLYLQQLNQLLKQTALAANAPADIAGLTGLQWLQFLDQSGHCNDFSQGPGKILLNGPYAPIKPSSDENASPQPRELEALARRWIKQHTFKSVSNIPC